MTTPFRRLPYNSAIQLAPQAQRLAPRTARPFTRQPSFTPTTLQRGPRTAKPPPHPFFAPLTATIMPPRTMASMTPQGVFLDEFDDEERMFGFLQGFHRQGDVGDPGEWEFREPDGPGQPSEPTMADRLARSEEEFKERFPEPATDFRLTPHAAMGPSMWNLLTGYMSGSRGTWHRGAPPPEPPGGGDDPEPPPDPFDPWRERGRPRPPRPHGPTWDPTPEVLEEEAAQAFQDWFDQMWEDALEAMGQEPDADPNDPSTWAPHTSLWKGVGPWAPSFIPEEVGPQIVTDEQLGIERRPPEYDPLFDCKVEAVGAGIRCFFASDKDWSYNDCVWQYTSEECRNKLGWR